jgi:3-hydroxyisobutyrate dehydrogenase-like beta-hydroxyacid dehydrogenase
MKVGFVGLGSMGTPMVRNLLRAGHEVIAYNRTRRKADELSSDGARVAGSVAEAAKSEVVVTMLADDAALEAVVFGSAGVLESLAPGGIHLSMSTISEALAKRMDAAHGEHGQTLVCAPVLGRPEAAAAAKLFIVAAGPSAAIQRCRPLFDVMGQKTFVVAEQPVRANVIKLGVNFMIAATIETLGESFALVRKHGIEPQTFLDVITSSLFAAPVYKTYGSLIAEQKYEAAGFRLALGLKDVRLALAAAESAQVPMPIASLVRDKFLSALARGKGEKDWSFLAALSAEAAGLE